MSGEVKNVEDKSFLTTWPGAFGSFKHSAAAIRFNLGTILSLVALSVVLTLAPDAISKDATFKDLAVIIANILSIIVSLALVYATLASARFKKIGLDEAIASGFSLVAIRYFLMNVLLAVIYVISFVLLIVPFLYIFPRTILAPYFMIDKDLGPIESIKASWYSTKGHVAKIYRILGVMLLMALAILILVGIYFLIMYSAVIALLYLYVTQHTETKASASPLSTATK